MADLRNTIFRSIRLISHSGFSVTIAHDADDYVLDEDGLDLGAVGGNHNTTQYIDLIGSHLDSTILQPRDINIVGWIIGEDEREIETRKILLNKAINPMYDVRLEFNDYALTFRPDSSILYARTWKENNEYMCKFQIQGTATMPLFFLKDPNTYGQTVELMSACHFPWTIPKDKGMVFGYYPMNSIAKMPNLGDVESGFKLTFDMEGAVKNPALVSLTNGEKVQFNREFEAGERLEICTELGEQYARIISHGKVANALKYLTADSSIDMKLALWINNLDVTADEGVDNIKAKLTFSPRFLEVEGR